MSRITARVPPNWCHPVSVVFDRSNVEFREEAVRMFPRPFEQDAAEWDAEAAAWAAGTHPEIVYDLADPATTTFVDYAGERPDPAEYAPWTEEEATWYQVWETTTEGTPVTPAFATPEELVEYLVEFGEDCQATSAGMARYCQAEPYDREYAVDFVKMGDTSKRDRQKFWSDREAMAFELL